jgi:hypothetical protein
LISVPSKASADATSAALPITGLLKESPVGTDRSGRKVFAVAMDGD